MYYKGNFVGTTSPVCNSHQTSFGSLYQWATWTIETPRTYGTMKTSQLSNSLFKKKFKKFTKIATESAKNGHLRWEGIKPQTIVMANFLLKSDAQTSILIRNPAKMRFKSIPFEVARPTDRGKRDWLPAGIPGRWDSVVLSYMVRVLYIISNQVCLPRLR